MNNIAPPMQDYFFGSMDEFIEVGYAPTARANCRNCRKRIGKGELRVGEGMDSDHFSHRYWYHLNCFTLKPLFAQIDPLKQIYNMEQLQEEGREAVAEHIGRQAKAMRNKKGRSRSGKKEEKAKKVGSDEEETEPAPTRVTRSASKRSKSTKREQSPEPSPSPSPSRPRRRNASRSTRGSARRVKKLPTEQGYSAEQKEKYEELLQKYMGMTADKLSEILGLNYQPKKGRKAELAQKCADGELLGSIPQCRGCGGGKLRFSRTTGLYHCPGYMDDEDFIVCNRYFTMKEVERTPWVLP